MPRAMLRPTFLRTERPATFGPKPISLGTYCDRAPGVRFSGTLPKDAPLPRDLRRAIRRYCDTTSLDPSLVSPY